MLLEGASEIDKARKNRCKKITYSLLDTWVTTKLRFLNLDYMKVFLPL